MCVTVYVCISTKAKEQQPVQKILPQDKYFFNKV